MAFSNFLKFHTIFPTLLTNLYASRIVKLRILQKPFKKPVISHKASMLGNTAGPLKASIINLLQQESLSQAGLQEQTGASLPTLRRAIQALTEESWISALGKTGATGGRPAVLYGVDANSHLIVGAHVESPAVNMVAVGLDGKTVEERQHIITSDLPPGEAIKVLTGFVADLRQTFPHRRLLGLGLATIGYVDAATGTILYVARAPGWENYPMKTQLEDRLSLPVFMENETDCLIRAELFNMNAQRSMDTIYLGMLQGLKVSMLLNGRIYSGAFGNAGLIGRTRVCPGTGRPTDASVLEQIASVNGVCTEFERRLRALSHVEGTLAQIQAIDDQKKKFYAILDAAAAEEPLCAAIVERMVEHLVDAVSDLIYVMQPVVLIVGGALSNPPPAISATLERAIRARLPALLSNHLMIRYASETGRFAPAKGAARMFLQRFVLTDAAFSN
jgi:N-acetylglucosamine repressor